MKIDSITTVQLDVIKFKFPTCEMFFSALLIGDSTALEMVHIW